MPWGNHFWILCLADWLPLLGHILTVRCPLPLIQRILLTSWPGSLLPGSLCWLTFPVLVRKSFNGFLKKGASKLIEKEQVSNVFDTLTRYRILHWKSFSSEIWRHFVVVVVAPWLLVKILWRTKSLTPEDYANLVFNFSGTSCNIPYPPGY